MCATAKRDGVGASRRERLDKVLVQRGLAETRSKAEALILAAEVLVRDEPVTKAGTMVAVDAPIRLRPRSAHFVGRGGEKLDGALDHFNLDLNGVIALDVGASTGGFTQCLLERGAAHVYAVDVGYNQLDLRLRNDSRVSVLERTNAKDLHTALFTSTPTLATIDVSFIGLRKILPAVSSVLSPGAKILALVKPQFELEPSYVSKGGVIRDTEHQLLAVKLVEDFARAHGLSVLGSVAAKIKGAKKRNQEYFLLLSLC